MSAALPQRHPYRARQGFRQPLSASAILARGLTKTFEPPRRTPFEWARRKPKRPAVEALRGVDLDVREGELFGLLGPNGAGKTTLVKILSTLLLPTSGDARVAGLDVRADADAIRRRVGVVLGGDRALYWRLTARENLWYFSQLYDMPRAKARDAIARVLAEVGLTDRADDRVENYSKGMKQRLHVARGLLTDPEILLLDEPSIGLDPHAARGLRALVRRLVDEDRRTILLTTHYLYEADELSDRVGILHKGRIVALDAPEALKARHARSGALVVRVRDPPSDVERRLATLPGVTGVARAPSADPAVAEFRLVGAHPEEAPERVAKEVAAAGARLLALHVEAPSLEDVFVSLTGEAMAGSAEAPPNDV